MLLSLTTKYVEIKDNELKQRTTDALPRSTNYPVYSGTSRKRPPKMSSPGGRLREVFCIFFIFFLSALHKRNTEKQKVQKKIYNLMTRREITKESSLHAVYNKNRIDKITKGQVTKFTKAEKKPKYVTAV